MTNEEKIAALRAMHKPNGIEHPMVWEVWNDGEVTLTKGGELYGQRNVHMVSPGNPDDALPVDSLFPRYKHSRIIVDDSGEANTAVEIIRGKCPWNPRWV